MTANSIGLKGLYSICQMNENDQLAFIAEGMPIIYASAQSLRSAALEIEHREREAEVLFLHSTEEFSKMLILLDMVRCPSPIFMKQSKKLVRPFYEHLARLIYAEMQGCKAENIKELRKYVDWYRQSHYLEGDAGEIIAPNKHIFDRENALYADVLSVDDDAPGWIEPCQFPGHFRALNYRANEIVHSLDCFGLLSADGIKLMRNIWCAVPFGDDSGWATARDLLIETIRLADKEGLIKREVDEIHANCLRDDWQMPMYDIDLSKYSIDLQELYRQREGMRAF